MGAEKAAIDDGTVSVNAEEVLDGAALFVGTEVIAPGDRLAAVNTEEVLDGAAMFVSIEETTVDGGSVPSIAVDSLDGDPTWWSSRRWSCMHGTRAVPT